MKKKLEKDIQREIADWLHSQGYFFWRQNNIPVFDKGNFRAMPKYSSKGSPDIMILHKGKFIGLEVKVDGYWKFTEDQERFRNLIDGNGGFYTVVTSLEQTKTVLDKFK